MSNIDTPEVNLEVLESTTVAAAAALDDRKSKLAFAKQVVKAREGGITDEQFADALVIARIERQFPGSREDSAAIDRHRKSFQMSSSKVSNYGTTLNQLTEAKAPITEQTFGDWFKLVTTGGSASARKELIAELPDVESKEEQAAAIHAIAFQFTAKPRVPSDPKLTLEKVEAFLAKVLETDFGSDKQAVVDAIFTAAGQLDDQPVETEAILQSA